MTDKDALDFSKTKNLLCIITEYDQSNGVFLATDNQQRSICFKAKEGDGLKDGSPEYRVGSKVILFRAQTLDSDEMVGNGTGFDEVDYSHTRLLTPLSQHGILNTSMVKTEFGCQILSINVWDERAINPHTPDGEKEIIEIADLLDKIGDSIKSPINNSEVGFQFRTVMTIRDNEGGVSGRQIIDLSRPMDWISGLGGVNDFGRPLDGSDLIAFLDGYTDYINQLYPHHENDLTIEVTKYKKYKNISPYSNCRSGLYQGSDFYNLGNGGGSEGVVMVGDPCSSGEKQVTGLYLHDNANIFPIQTMIKTADGLSVDFHPNLPQDQLSAWEMKDVTALLAARREKQEKLLYQNASKAVNPANR